MFRRYPAQFYVLLIAVFINRAGTFLMPAMTFFLRSKINATTSEAGVAVATFGCGAIFSALFGGYIADKYGRKITMLTSLLANAIVVTSFVFLSSYTHILVACFLLGAIFELFRPASSAFINDILSAEQRIGGYNWYFWVINFGFAISTSIGGYFATKNFNLVLYADAASTLICAAVLFYFTTESWHPHQTPVAFSDFLYPLKNKTFRMFVFISFLTCLVIYQFQVALATSMQSHQLTAFDYGIANSMNGVFIIALQPYISHFSRKFRRRDVLSLAALLIGLGFFSHGFAQTTFHYCVGVIIWTVGEILMSPTNSTIVSDFAPTHSRGRHHGMLGLAWSTAAVVGSLAGSWGAEHYGHRLVFTGCLVLMFAAAYLHQINGAGRQAAFKEKTPESWSRLRD